MALQKDIIIVEGMSCGHCKKAVEKAVMSLPGVVAAEVDLAEKTLQVEYDTGKTASAEIKAAVEDAGFTAV